MIDLSKFMDDPNWDSFIPDVPSYENEKCSLPAHEDCHPLDVEALAIQLQAGGTLGHMKGYEERPGQIDMLRAVAQAFNAREHLMIEAGTGVGKSLAYLIPAVWWSWRNNTPVIISTKTRHLQSQLLEQDLPRAVQTLGADIAPLFRYALLKGRTNYICLHQMASVMQDGFWVLTDEQKSRLSHLVEWLHATQTGDLDTLGDEKLRYRLECAPEQCLGKYCPHRQKCFITKARLRAKAAHVVVVNHALVMADTLRTLGALLPPSGRLIFDEAHTLEEVATSFFTWKISPETLVNALGILIRTSKSNRLPQGQPQGLVTTVENYVTRSRTPPSDRMLLLEQLRKIITQVNLIQRESENFFKEVEKFLIPLKDVPKNQLQKLRYRCVPQRQYAVDGIFCDYRPHELNEVALNEAYRTFEELVAHLMIFIDELIKQLKETVEDDEAYVEELCKQITEAKQRILEFIQEAEFTLKGESDEYVYWAERTRPARKRPSVISLMAAPLSIAQNMNDAFYQKRDSIVLCSATLRAHRKFDYMAKKLGLSLVEKDRVKMLVASSPFQYDQQVLGLVADYLPDPKYLQSYALKLATLLRDLFHVMKGRGLVLFTSYEMLQATAQEAHPLLEAIGQDLLVQGEEHSREALVAELKGRGVDASKKPLIIFGAQSFWEGVDVPGDALSCVVITRLPFPQLGEPIVEARREKIDKEGKKSFPTYFMPEALIRFQQGFGRLIRTQTDRGVVVVTDPRIISKSYGRSFCKSVPSVLHTVNTASEMIGAVQQFLDRKAEHAPCASN